MTNINRNIESHSKKMQTCRIKVLTYLVRKYDFLLKIIISKVIGRGNEPRMCGIAQMLKETIFAARIPSLLTSPLRVYEDKPIDLRLMFKGK